MGFIAVMHRVRAYMTLECAYTIRRERAVTNQNVFAWGSAHTHPRSAGGRRRWNWKTTTTTSRNKVLIPFLRWDDGATGTSVCALCQADWRTLTANCRRQTVRPEIRVRRGETRCAASGRWSRARLWWTNAGGRERANVRRVPGSSARAASTERRRLGAARDHDARGKTVGRNDDRVAEGWTVVERRRLGSRGQEYAAAPTTLVCGETRAIKTLYTRGSQLPFGPRTPFKLRLD